MGSSLRVMRALVSPIVLSVSRILKRDSASLVWNTTEGRLVDDQILRLFAIYPCSACQRSCISWLLTSAGEIVKRKKAAVCFVGESGELVAEMMAMGN